MRWFFRIAFNVSSYRESKLALVYSFNLVCVSLFFSLSLYHFVVTVAAAAAAALAWYIFYKPSRKWWYIYDYIERKTEQNGMTLLFVFWVSDIHENTIILHHICMEYCLSEHLSVYAILHSLPARPPALEFTWTRLNLSIHSFAFIRSLTS